MIRAEVIDHPGVEVPNWVTKCKAVLTSGPVSVIMAAIVIAAIGVVAWHGRPASLSSTAGIQSQPASGSLLTVTTANEQPVQAVNAQPGTTSSSPDNSAAAPAANVGPAPASSLSSLQPTGTSNQNSNGLSQAVGQPLQSANGAASSILQNLQR